MISLQGVSKKYDNGHLALDNISMEIEAGEFVFLCGASGAGKSTLIRLLFREEIATDGKISVNNRNLRKIKRRDLLKHRRSIGMVFQDYRLLPKKNVYDNVAYAMEVTECKNKDIKKRVPEQQRVAIARALVNRPAILIADEPTGNLDPQNAWELMDVLNRINEKGTTIVMATHAKDIVDRMKKRVIMLSDGHIVYDEAEGGYHEVTVI